MESQWELFNQFFSSNRNGEELILCSSERLVAELVYAFACCKIREDLDRIWDDSIASLDNRIQALREIFRHVVELLKLSSKAKSTFLEKFNDWSEPRKNNVKRLEEIAGEIETNKSNCAGVKVVSKSTAIVGVMAFGLSFLPIVAPIATMVCIGGIAAGVMGTGIYARTLSVETDHLNRSLEEAQTLRKKGNNNNLNIQKWFARTGELKKALASLIDYDLLNEMSKKDLQDFRNKVKKNLDISKDKFKKVLTVCIGKLCKQSKIIESYGVDLAPVVMTFVLVVCLMRDHNRTLLDCMVQIHHLVIRTGVQMGKLEDELDADDEKIADVTNAIVLTTFIGPADDIVSEAVATNSSPESDEAKKIRKEVKMLKHVLSCIGSFHEEFKKWKSMDWTDVTKWETIIIRHVPNNAGQENLKMAIRPHLSEDAWGCIKLQKSSMEGNNWLLAVPASHSQMLLRQSHLVISKESCRIMQLDKKEPLLIPFCFPMMLCKKTLN